MILSKFIKGLQILQPYYDKDGYDIGAEHDVFYAYKTARRLSDEDVKKMRELGWFQEAVPSNEDNTPGPYDPEEGWTAYT